MMQKMTEAQRELAERNMPLVTWALQNRLPCWRRDEYDDLFQAGALGLCKAAMHYDEQAGICFSTYAHSCIFGEMRNELKRMRRQEIRAGAARLEDAVTQETDAITLASNTAGVEDGRAMERMLILQETMDRIKGRERRALDLHIEGFTQVEIGRRMRMSQPSVNRILRRARKLIADEYAR